MKDTGVIRRIDNLGRVVLPIHFRKKLGILENDDVEITLDENDQITIKKYNSLSGMRNVFDSVAISIYQMIQGTILIVDEDRIISSYGQKSYSYKKNLEISSELKRRILSGTSSLPSGKLIDSFIEESTSYISPINGRNGKPIGAIVYIYEGDLLKNISQLIESYAIFITEMLR